MKRRDFLRSVAAAAALGVTWMTVGLDGADSMAEWRRLVDALASDVVGSAP